MLQIVLITGVVLAGAHRDCDTANIASHHLRWRDAGAGKKVQELQMSGMHMSCTTSRPWSERCCNHSVQPALTARSCRRSCHGTKWNAQ